MDIARGLVIQSTLLSLKQIIDCRINLSKIFLFHKDQFCMVSGIHPKDILKKIYFNVISIS